MTFLYSLPDEKGYTPLHCAAERGSLESVKVHSTASHCIFASYNTCIDAVHLWGRHAERDTNWIHCYTYCSIERSCKLLKGRIYYYGTILNFLLLVVACIRMQSSMPDSG